MRQWLRNGFLWLPSTANTRSAYDTALLYLLKIKYSEEGIVIIHVGRSYLHIDGSVVQLMPKDKGHDVRQVLKCSYDPAVPPTVEIMAFWERMLPDEEVRLFTSKSSAKHRNCIEWLYISIDFRNRFLGVRAYKELCGTRQIAAQG